MPDWTIDEHKTAGGQSYFADFVAGLTDAKDIKDAAVLTGALRALGKQLREPRSKSLENGLFELRGTRVRIYYGFVPGRRIVLVGGIRQETHRYSGKGTPTDAREIEGDRSSTLSI
jgi:hypothetical protein